MVKKVLSILFIATLLISCEEIFEVTDISEQQVELLSPTNASVVSSNVVSFNWNGVEEADSYLIQIATPNFDSASQFALDTVITIDSTFVGNRLTKMLPNNQYEWRVQAQNSQFFTEFSSSVFTVDNQE